MALNTFKCNLTPLHFKGSINVVVLVTVVYIGVYCHVTAFLSCPTGLSVISAELLPSTLADRVSLQRVISRPLVISPRDDNRSISMDAVRHIIINLSG